MNSVTAFAPASVSNLACGFDVLGLALNAPGDEVTVQTRPEPGVVITELTGDEGRLPREADRNTAGVAAAALLRMTGVGQGVALKLHKGLPLASGLGSSAASAVAAVVAVNELLNLNVSREKQLECALEGERVACGAAHPDNAAPSLYGGLVLARSAHPPDIVSLAVPQGMTCAVVRPHMEVETAKARALLGDTVLLRDAVTQWGNLAGFIAGLYTSDYELIARSLRDVVAEPKRASLVPGFAEVKQAAVMAGALGCSLSGSGPSIFALCRTEDDARRVGAAMALTLSERTGLAADLFVSPVGARGAHVIRKSEAACAS